MLLGCRQSHYNKEKIAYGILINVLNLQRDHWTTIFFHTSHVGEWVNKGTI